MNLVESLKTIGLNDKEAKVYLALLQLGKATAYNVAVRSGLKKPTTYVILDQLVEKGFAYKIPRAKKQRYAAESPDKCFALAKERFSFYEKALPELMAMKKGKDEKVRVAYYEGVKGAYEMYQNLVEVMKEKPADNRNIVGFYGKGDKISPELEECFFKVNSELGHNNIKRRVVTVYHSSIIEKYLKNDILEKFLMNVKALAENKYSSDISIEVYDNFVQILSQKSLQGVLIEDADIAKAIGQIFEMVWELVEKDRENYLKFSSEEAFKEKEKGEPEDINITINKISSL